MRLSPAPGPRSLRIESRNQTSGIQGFPCYRTVEETFSDAADTCTALPTAQLEWGTTTVSSTPVTVPLANVYTSPVVVTAVRYSNNTVPVVTRISNVTPFAAAPTVGLVTQAGMQSSEGSWAQAHGPTLATPTTLFLSVDEDQIGRGERRHSTEQVGYVVFATEGVVP